MGLFNYNEVEFLIIQPFNEVFIIIWLFYDYVLKETMHITANLHPLSQDILLRYIEFFIFI